MNLIGCQISEYGCCQDDKHPAHGPNFLGNKIIKLFNLFFLFTDQLLRFFIISKLYKIVLTEWQDLSSILSLKFYHSALKIGGRMIYSPLYLIYFYLKRMLFLQWAWLLPWLSFWCRRTFFPGKFFSFKWINIFRIFLLNSK